MILKSEQDTKELACSYASLLKEGEVVALSGALGSGKTTFARHLIRTLCGDEKLDVPSPTFTLLQIYETPTFPVWHFDFYRLKSPEEIWELGWEEDMLKRLTLVEWPERLGPYLPTKRLDIHFVCEGNSRHVTISQKDHVS